MQSAISKLEAAIAEVPWSSLHHAYGSASDVPSLLRELASGHRRRQLLALHAFYGNIWHQGTIYPASAPTARCLLTLLRQSQDLGLDDPQELFEKVLTLLLHLASGYGEGGPELQDECRQTLAQDIELYQHLLHHPHPRVRMRTAHLLGLLQSPNAVAQLMAEFSAEPAAEVRAARALALGQHPGVRAQLVELCRHERDPAVELAILLAIARSSDVLAVSEHARLSELLRRVPVLAQLQSWQDPELEQALDPLPRYVCSVASPAKFALLVPFAELLGSLDSDDRWCVALAWDLVVSTFSQAGNPLTFDDLHPDQRRILRCLATWSVDDVVQYLCEPFDLGPEEIREHLCTILGCSADELEPSTSGGESEASDDDVEIPGVRIPSLDKPFCGPYTDAQQTLAHRAAEVLHQVGFHESRAWHKAFVQLANAGLTMHPAALGRHFGGSRNVTVGLDFHDADAQKQFADTTNYRLAGEYLKLVYTDQEDRPELTLRVGLAKTDDATLRTLSQAIAASVDEDTLAGVLAAMEPVAAPLLVEFGESHFAILTRTFHN